MRIMNIMHIMSIMSIMYNNKHNKKHNNMHNDRHNNMHSRHLMTIILGTVGTITGPLLGTIICIIDVRCIIICTLCVLSYKLCV